MSARLPALRDVPPRCVALSIVLFMIPLLTGCGGARTTGLSTNRAAQYHYDEKLQLRLEEIISGRLGTADLRDPISIEAAADGGLIVLEQNPPRVIVLDSSRQVLRQIGGSGSGLAGLNRPRFVRSGFGLTINIADESGRVLVYDSRLRLISTFEPAYEASGYASGSPTGIAVADFGDTYLADRDNDVIYHFDPGGKFVGTIGGEDAGAGRLSRPEGLVITGDGTLIACDTDARRIVLFNQHGEFLASIGDGELDAPISVALAPDEESVFIGDRKNGRLDLYSLSGRWLVSWDGAELVPGGIREITDLAVKDMFLYLVDAGNKQILKFRLVPSLE